MIDFQDLSADTQAVVTQLEQQGYRTALEFKSKVDWPKEDESPKDERYIFACTLTPGENGDWVVEVAPCPNEAISKVINKLNIT